MSQNTGASAVSVLMSWMRGESPPLLTSASSNELAYNVVTAKQVGIALYGPYLLAVELGSMLLLAALVTAFHLGRQDDKEEGETP